MSDYVCEKLGLQQALNLMRKRIEEGAYQTGERLPSQRDLAQRLGISRHLLSVVLQELENTHYIDRHSGTGIYVAHPPIH